MRLFSITTRAFALCVMLVVFSASHFQGAELQRLGTAIRQNNVGQLLLQTGNQIQVNIFGESNLYSQTQARFVLESFFSNYPGADFSFRDTWNGATGSFAVGNYMSRQQNIQVYIRTQKVANKEQLKEIRFSQNSNR